MRLHGARAVAASAWRDPEQARRAIADWLLDSVQLSVGPHAGGVAGAVASDGSALYVYPEITGYYLQWLSSMASRQDPVSALAQRADAAQRWLGSWIACCYLPATRVHLREHEADWRNSASFCFDLAMVLRGVASAAAAGLIEPDSLLIEQLFVQLSRLAAADGEFVAYVAPSGVELADRWSTRRGGFLAKAAAAVLAAARVLPRVPAALQAVAEATLAASIRAAIEHPHDEAHPQLYAIEGALILASHPAVIPVLPQLAQQVQGLLSSATLHGALTESFLPGGVERLDIVAQALRAAYFLRAAAPEWSPSPRALHRTQHFLLRYTTLEGGIPFNTAAGRSVYCTWAAMFAEQALAVAPMTPANLTRGEETAYLV